MVRGLLATGKLVPMAQYFMNEGVFDLPEMGFRDKTVHLFAAPLEGGSEIGLVVCRARVARGKTLRDVVRAHLDGEVKNLRAFTILEQTELECAGHDALSVASRYRNGSEMAYQRQVHLVAYGQWILFGATAPIAERDACDRCLGEVVSTFRLREP